MTTSPLNSMHQSATALLQAGRVAEAESLFHQILQAYPNYGPAHFFIGAIAHRAGQLPKALQHLHRATQLNPELAEPHFVMGIVLQQQQRYSEAIAAYQKCLALRPGDSKCLNNMGRALLDSGKVAESIVVLRQAVTTKPPNPGAFSNLGDALRSAGNSPTDLAAAMQQYQAAIALDPNCAEAHGNLGILLSQRGRLDESAASIRRAIAINPKSYNPRFNLARVLQDDGQFEAALEQCQIAIQLRPESADAHNLLGNLLGFMGQVPECIAAQTRAVEIKPDFAAGHSNLLLSLHYLDEYSPQQIFQAHQQWARQHSRPRVNPARYRNESPANRRLRIGYVSPNFNSHSVAYFFEPVLAAHDRSGVEVFCYSDVKVADATTHRLQALADHWRDIAGQSDAQVTELILEDGIDILIDLAGHTASNRMTLFSAKPAPVQMSWIGYPNTTGLSAIDYRLTDAIADPPGSSDALHTEKLIRLEGGPWAYAGPTQIEVGALPALSSGFITLGCFNNLPKVTPRVLETWASVLQQIPNSRLILKAAGLSSITGRNYILEHLTKKGVDPGRIEILSWAASSAAHFEFYNRVDIALDTFPYSGTTTTCEALWMGVPVVTVTGDTHVSRVGAALLTHAGLADWIASDLADYITKVVAMASNLPALANIRSTLRDRLAKSPLCDPHRLARQLEIQFRQSLVNPSL